MQTVLVVFAVMCGLSGLMAIGVLLGRAPLAGSCGGLANLGDDGACSVCGRPPDEACGGALRVARRAPDPLDEPRRPDSGRAAVRDAAADP